MVCSAATAATARPAAVAASAVTGPMHTTTGGTEWGPAAARYPATVEPEVKVMASAAAARATVSAGGTTGTVRYAVTASTPRPAARRPSARTGRAASAWRRSTLPPPGG